MFRHVRGLTSGLVASLRRRGTGAAPEARHAHRDANGAHVRRIAHSAGGGGGESAWRSGAVAAAAAGGAAFGTVAWLAYRGLDPAPHPVAAAPVNLLRLAPTSELSDLPGRSGGGGRKGGGAGPPMGRFAISEAAERVAPAVVNITISQEVHGRGGFSIAQGVSSGSGFIISPDGTILTSAHVVSEGGGAMGGGIMGGRFFGTRSAAKAVKVSLQDGQTFDGRVVGFDAQSDIAVVKVDAPRPLPSADLGASCDLRVGEWVLALGSPLTLHNSITAGIVSAVDRKGADIGIRGRGSVTEFIQTDAAINQGNSGGPLVDLDGLVIGINNMKALAADGVSFAIPIDVATGVVDQLRKFGRVPRPYVGIKMLELNPAIARELEQRDRAFPPGITAGVLIPHVLEGSPGDRGGLRAGDVVTHLDGKAVLSPGDIVDGLGAQVGKAVEFTVRRAGGRAAKIRVTTEDQSSVSQA